MKNKLIILLISSVIITTYSQNVGRQCLSSIGNTTILKKGYTISQSIGQQSAVYGSRRLDVNRMYIQQGFQQGVISSLSIENEKNNSVTIYPNPIDNHGFIAFKNSLFPT